ncbi:MAG: hypothetical protein AB1861_06530 [Cyanobacteriota bacterium]
MQAESPSIDTKELLRSIQEAASTSLKKLPPAPTKQDSQDEVNLFLTQAGNLLEEGTKAMTWNDEQLQSFVLQTALLRLGFEAGMKYSSGTNTDVKPQTENPGCTFRCEELRNDCITRSCGNGTSWPCGCCVPCNITWMACLADCVVG